MSPTTPARTRRGLAVTAVVVGALSTVMIVGFWLLGAASDGQGLSNAVVLAVLLFYGALVVGAVAVLLGVAAILLSRPRLYGIVGVVLGAVPFVALALSPAFPGA